MPGYTLHKISASAWKITQGRAKVGFVNACPKGFVARIGQHCETAATPQEAFQLVASKALGFSSPAAVRQHNSEVRAVKRARKAEARSAVNEYLSGGNVKPLWDLIEKIANT